MCIYTYAVTYHVNINQTVRPVRTANVILEDGYTSFGDIPKILAMYDGLNVTDITIVTVSLVTLDAK